jgi:hypothetical protein
MSNDHEKNDEWKLHYESRNAETGLNIQLNKLEDEKTGLILFSFRLGRIVDSGKGGQFIPVRIKGKPGSRDVHSWSSEIVNLIQEAEEQALLYIHKKDIENSKR